MKYERAVEVFKQLLSEGYEGVGKFPELSEDVFHEWSIVAKRVTGDAIIIITFGGFGNPGSYEFRFNTDLADSVGFGKRLGIEIDKDHRALISTKEHSPRD